MEHPWIKGKVRALPKQKSSLLLKKNKPQSMKKLFLVNEVAIDLSDDEELSDDASEQWSSMPENGILKRGYLKKEGKVFKSWKKRWFILQNNGKVSYYHDHKDLNKPIATFDVRGYTKLIRSTKIKNCIILCTTERNWKFVCSNDA